MNTPCHILVPANFSTRSDAALDYATQLAQRVGATIDLLHVRGTPAKRRRGETLPPSFFADSDEGIAMEEALSRGLRGRIDIHGRVEFGDVCETIARVAESGDFDLIVIGQHGRSATSARPQDVARQVALRVRCPVLILDAEMVPDSLDPP